MELPSDCVRLPLPFAVFCTQGPWRSFCVCNLISRAAGERGGWHVGWGRHLSEGFQRRRWEADLDQVAQSNIHRPEHAEGFADEVRSVILQFQEGQE
eukprot:11170206-Heterocapsa_arctica.AAC.1